MFYESNYNTSSPYTLARSVAFFCGRLILAKFRALCSYLNFIPEGS